MIHSKALYSFTSVLALLSGMPAGALRLAIDHHEIREIQSWQTLTGGSAILSPQTGFVDACG